MKIRILFLPFLLPLLSAGCASSDRMARLSGGVLDEYAPPPATRLRAERYRKQPQNLASFERANRSGIAAVDAPPLNLWPFFFRSADYWTLLWPLIDKDPYGFAVRPFYNHEGDDYSILFPLAAWNPAAGHGWVALGGWNEHGFGVLPFFWRWHDPKRDGAFCLPLFLFERDRTPLDWNISGKRGNWSRTDHWLWGGLLFVDRHRTSVERQNWAWLYNRSYAQLRNEWRYRFRNQRPFPADKRALDEFRQKIFDTLPRRTERTHALLPLWWWTGNDGGDSFHRFLLVAGYERDKNESSWDFLGKLGAQYRSHTAPPGDHFRQGETSFTALMLLSHFRAERRFRQTGVWEKLEALERLRCGSGSFERRKPALGDALAQLDPALKLPDTVVDDMTLYLYLDELRQKYELPVDTHYHGCVAPLFWYKLTPRSARWVLPALLTWWGHDRTGADFISLPLLTFYTRSPERDCDIVLSPLTWYSRTVRRARRDYPVLERQEQTAPENQCTELRDRYAVCGLFYRGRFGFNVVKDAYDAETVENLRRFLARMPERRKRLDARAERLAEQTDLADRWQTKTEIERLKKLIRYEELKIDRAKLDRDEKEFQNDAAKARALAAQLQFPLAPDALNDLHAAQRAADALLEHAAELRYYEDIGNRIFYHRENYDNGDWNWRLFFGLLAGGEKRGERETTHVLHLLYRKRREGKRVEKVYFPFITAVEDGDDASFSFLYRVFSLTRRGGKSSGYICFIPFGDR